MGRASGRSRHARSAWLEYFDRFRYLPDVTDLTIDDATALDPTVRLAASGDQAAFAHLVTEHHASMVRVACTITGVRSSQSSCCWWWRHGMFCVAQPCRGDEQPSGLGPRGRRRDEPDLPELGPGDLDRDLLHAVDRRAVLDASGGAQRRAPGPRRRGTRCRPCRRKAPPISVLFAAFLGYNPIPSTLAPAATPWRTCRPRLTPRSPATPSSRI